MPAVESAGFRIGENEEKSNERKSKKKKKENLPRERGGREDSVEGATKLAV